MGLFARPLGHQHGTGVQGQGIEGAVPVQMQAVPGDQLPGHEHEDFVYVLGLLG